MKKNFAISHAPNLVIKVGDLKEYLIGINQISGREKRTPIYYSYKDVEYDIDGWADCARFLPDDYDFVFMRLLRNKTIAGWISGYTWTGLRLKQDDVVVFWKRKEEEKAA